MIIFILFLLVGLSLSGKVFSEHVTFWTTWHEITYSDYEVPYFRKCVVFGLCGELEFLSMTCTVNQDDQQLEENSFLELKTICPELIQEHGSYLCCSTRQVDELITNLRMPQTLVNKCPSCFHNFRRSFCEFTCSPYHSEFLNLTHTSSAEDVQKLPQEVFEVVDFYSSKNYLEGSFDTCKNMRFMNVPATDFLCGSGGFQNCVPERRFQYFRSMSTDNSPQEVNVTTNQTGSESDFREILSQLEKYTDDSRNDSKENSNSTNRHTDSVMETATKCACPHCPVDEAVFSFSPPANATLNSKLFNFLHAQFFKEEEEEKEKYETHF